MSLSLSTACWWRNVVKWKSSRRPGSSTCCCELLVFRTRRFPSPAATSECDHPDASSCLVSFCWFLLFSITCSTVYKSLYSCLLTDLLSVSQSSMNPDLDFDDFLQHFTSLRTISWSCFNAAGLWSSLWSGFLKKFLSVAVERISLWEQQQPTFCWHQPTIGVQHNKEVRQREKYTI